MVLLMSSPLHLPSGFTAQPFSLALLPPVHYDPKAAVLGMESAGTVGVGIGGQIHRVLIPGVGEAVAGQAIDSHWVDRVIQIACTWSAVDNPESGADLHIHQGGTYSRWLLANKRQFDSPILWRQSLGVSYETLNLWQQAHIDTAGYMPDRFIGYTRYRRVSLNTIEVDTAVINHSQYIMPTNILGETPLDRFNIPWAMLRMTNLPTALVEFGNGNVRDISGVQWATGQDDDLNNRAIAWCGLFRSQTGVGLAIIPPVGTIGFKCGWVDKRVVVEDGRTSPPWTTTMERQFVIAPRYGLPIRFGQMLMARWYLCVGARPNEVSVQAAIRRPHAFITTAAAPPLFSYELLDQGRTLYSMQPYMGRGREYAVDGRYQIRRVVGWPP